VSDTTTTPPPPPMSEWPPNAAPAAAPAQVIYVKAAGNGLAVAGFVTALVGVACGMIPLFFIGAFFWGILGITFSILGRRKATHFEHAGHGKLAIAGIVLSGLAFVLGGVGASITGSAVKDLDKSFSNLSSYNDCVSQISYSSPTFSSQMAECERLYG
jgi:hypothetical protein